LLENVIALRNLASSAAAARAVLDQKDADKLKELGKELDEAMDDLDDLL
jgi:hypothetical protein